MTTPHKMLSANVSFIMVLLVILSLSCRQEPEPIYDEADVPKYTLPSLFTDSNTDPVSLRNEWQETRKKEVLQMFESEMYGVFPNGKYKVKFEVKKEVNNFLDSTAILKEIEATVSTENGDLKFRILSVMPISENPVPVFVGLNFRGNHSVDSCTAITLDSIWKYDWETKSATVELAGEASRGTRSSRWPLSTIVNRGYGLSTVYYEDFDPDYDDGDKNGLHPLFAEADNRNISDDPGSISIWAKGMSLMVDQLLTDPSVDHDRMIAIGHSRLGKTALWAGVNDERFAAAISNNSGCGGAALSRREFGETVRRINTAFPHWFCTQFRTYNKKVSKLPIDQHMLLALMAPRPVYVASATEDQWADPRGEFLALKEATAVYDLFGFKQDFPEEQPPPDQSYQGITGYHLRTGPHDLTEADWVMYMDWADKWVR